jgi:hypothetical protein
MKRIQRGEFDSRFSNATLEEMAALVKQHERTTNRRNKLLILGFCLLLGLVVAIGVNLYGHWLTETMHASGQVLSALWHWQWWQAAAILLEYKLSFFLLGVIVGVIVALFIVFQVVETLIDLIWDGISSLFS